MLSYIKGKLEQINNDTIIIECHGMGIELSMPASMIENLPALGTEVYIHTYFKLAEDTMLLYGFDSRAGLEMFKLLLGVNGIGPKAALSILSSMDIVKLKSSIVCDDAASISKAQGVGQKTAKRIILELKDKVSLDDSDYIKPHAKSEIDNNKEAVAALLALGYNASEANRAVNMVEGNKELGVETVLKKALKYLIY